MTVMQPCRGSILVHCRQRGPISLSQLCFPVLLADCLETNNAFTEVSCAICNIATYANCIWPDMVWQEISQQAWEHRLNSDTPVHQHMQLFGRWTLRANVGLHSFVPAYKLVDRQLLRAGVTL